MISKDTIDALGKRLMEHGMKVEKVGRDNDDGWYKITYYDDVVEFTQYFPDFTSETAYAFLKGMLFMIGEE